MQDASDESDASSDNTNSIPDDDSSSISSYISRDSISSGWSDSTDNDERKRYRPGKFSFYNDFSLLQGRSGCICGDSRDSDWTDENTEECKRDKLEVDTKLSAHEQLHRAIRFHDCKTIRQLLEDGVEPCTIYKNSSNCFVLARDSKFLLKKFLEIEPSGVNCQDSDGYTMLMLTVHRNKDVFDFLCKYRPDVNLLNDNGDDILHYVLTGCLYYNDQSIVERILDLGLDVNVVDSSGENALALAVKAGSNANIVGMLLDRGATMPPPDEDGKTILMHAIGTENVCFRDKVEVLKLLFQYGADASAKDRNGHNAMYYIISECIPKKLYSTYGMNSLEEIIIMLLKHNCEVQRLGLTYGDFPIIRTIYLNSRIRTCEGSCRPIHVKYDVVSTLVRSNLSIKLLKELLKRGLYSSTNSNPNVFSPLSACLIQLILDVSPRIGQRILDTAKEMILFGVDVSQRIWHEQICPGYTEPLEYNHRTRAVYQAAVAKELDIPDALFFVANMRISYSGSEEILNPIKLAVEELLRLLLRFWPHPPLLLMLLRVDPISCPSLITTSRLDISSHTGMHFIMKVLAKIGGPLLLGTRYYTILKSALQRMAERSDLCQPMLNLLLEAEGEIPSLRKLSRDAFRATVKKTCSNGLDFSRYRVLCQGQMVPLPEKIINFIQFRV